MNNRKKFAVFFFFSKLLSLLRCACNVYSAPLTFPVNNFCPARPDDGASIVLLVQGTALVLMLLDVARWSYWLPFVGDVIIIMTFRIVTDLGCKQSQAACLNVCGKVAKLSSAKVVDF